MVRSPSFLHHFLNRRLSDSFKTFFFIPTALALTTCVTILIYITSISDLILPPRKESPYPQLKNPSNLVPEAIQPHNSSLSTFLVPQATQFIQTLPYLTNNSSEDQTVTFQNAAGFHGNEEVFHDRETFLEDYIEMNRSLKIYVYPHTKDDPHAHALLPVEKEPSGNYASESYFKKNLMQSHFITKNPLEADLFYLPFSIARLRHDPGIGVRGIPKFVQSYIQNISRKYPYWNRTGGADHFYVACHSIGRSAMEKAPEVKFNAIQVVCSSSYFLSGYIAHKDASLPQIWPRQGDPPNVALSNRKKLAFFAGAVNSPVRKKVLEAWKNDSDIFVNAGRLTTPYSDELLGSKYCLHVKGFEVNTARIGDAVYYGCVPVIIANHYDLPFADILNWKSFSIVVATLDVPLLKEILLGVSRDEYEMLQRNVLSVRRHFRWNLIPVDYDIFHMVMYELWLRRSTLRFSLVDFRDSNEQYMNSCM